ncbi:helix-turn-helix domain-containing protein [Vagococcus silagei]|uniref:Helix-turn-helix domain-containing protein n=1 Tax=Vagococcus silagei TaxID=2508885 RepID=A0A4S3B610_9ENTE|nr:helix-turn-helix domain-containing protein [Vagococcus silagei]THB61787.1 helix-turn-helix domain-containing protein [Vagococcus silagei]
MDTIGEKLKKDRIEKGLTIGDLQRITKIQRRYLEAIEENDFDALPSDYYTRTFVRQYAEAVGQNPRPLLRRLEGKPENPNDLAIADPVKGSRKSKYDQTSRSKTFVRNYLPVTLLLLLVLAIFGTVIYAILLDSEQGPLIPTPEKTTVVKSEESSSVAQSEKTETSSSEETTETTKKEKEKEKTKELKVTEVLDSPQSVKYTLKSSASPHEIEFKGLDGPAWIGIQESGTTNMFYQYTLQPGETVTAEIPEEYDDVDIVVGASNNLSIGVEGKLLPFNKKNPVTGKKIVTLGFEGTKENKD